MNIPLRLTLIALVAPMLSLAQDGGLKPVTSAQALKLGPEKLAEFTEDESEVGMDEAARLYATALRLKTENALAKVDLRQVNQLNTWREMITACRLSPFGLAAIINGGGTMYSHGAARDASEVEDFLAGVAADFPPAEGEGSAKARKMIQQNVAFLKKLKPGELVTEKEDRANFAAEVKKACTDWENLGYLADSLPAEVAEQIVTFAAGTMEWLKEEN
ncbi:MAG: hypothetical protein IPK22_28350 [Verrucomicrobiaceae bacterium]|nr:hypothetical protein [Verrucomicrobiaceae bacterium]